MPLAVGDDSNTSINNCIGGEIIDSANSNNLAKALIFLYIDTNNTKKLL